jgi:hypothetical protein
MPLDEKNRLTLDKVFMAFGSQMHALERNIGDEAWRAYREDAWAWSITKVSALVDHLYGEGKTETPPTSEKLGETETITVKGVILQSKGMTKLVGNGNSTRSLTSMTITISRSIAVLRWERPILSIGNGRRKKVSGGGQFRIPLDQSRKAAIRAMRPKRSGMNRMMKFLFEGSTIKYTELWIIPDSPCWQ